MRQKRATAITEYIRNAPRAGQPHLRKLYAILKRAAPKAAQKIKWGMPFFVEPHFLFAFSAHKAHLSFAPMAAAMKPFRNELKKHKTTKNYLQIPYDEPMPAALVRKIALRCVRVARERDDERFW